MLTDRVGNSVKEALDTMEQAVTYARGVMDYEEAFDDRDQIETVALIQSKLVQGVAHANTSILEAIKTAILERQLAEGRNKCHTSGK